jgi:isoamylase
MTAVPLGATVEASATSFAVFSGVADALDLCLFDEHGGERRQPLEMDEGFVWRGTAETWNPTAIMRTR